MKGTKSKSFSKGPKFCLVVHGMPPFWQGMFWALLHRRLRCRVGLPWCGVFCWMLVLLWWNSFHELQRATNKSLKVFSVMLGLHPQSLTWNRKMVVSNMNLIFQGAIFRFDVELQGCTCSFLHGWLVEWKICRAFGVNPCGKRVAPCYREFRNSVWAGFRKK